MQIFFSPALSIAASPPTPAGCASLPQSRFYPKAIDWRLTNSEKLRTKNLFPLLLFSFAIVVPVSYRHRGPQEKAKEIDTCSVRHTKGQRSAGLTLLQNVDLLRMTETKDVLSCGGKLIASKITNNTTAHHVCELPVGSS